MRPHFAGRYRTALWCVVAVAGMGQFQLQANEVDLRLQEQTGHDWRAELVHWPLPGKDLWHIVDDAGSPVPCQQYEHAAAVTTPLEGAGIYALVDLPANGAVHWRLRPGAAPKTQPQVRVLREPAGLVLATDVIEVRLAPAMENAKNCSADSAVPAPIQALRLPGGPWFGGGEVRAAAPLRRHSVAVTAEGPLFAEAEVLYEYPQDRQYLCRIRVAARQPVVHITEQFNLGPDSQMTLRFRRAPMPDTFYGTLEKHGHLVAPMETPLKGRKPGLLARLAAWQHYGLPPDAAWMALLDSQAKGPVLGLVTTFPQIWRHPEPIEISLCEGSAFACRFSLDHGIRSYCMYLATAAQYASAAPNGIAQAKRRYGETPLQRAKDWVLRWPQKAEYPQLFFSRSDLPAIRKRLEIFPDRLKDFSRLNPKPGFLEDLTSYYILSGDERAVAHILKSDVYLKEPLMGMQTVGLLPELRMRVGTMLEGYGLWPQGINTIMWLPDHFLHRVLSADMVLGSPSLADSHRQELRKLLAILAYQMESEEKMPPREAGFLWGTANMPSGYFAVLGMLGALLPDHPHADRWMRRAVEELRKDVYRNTREDGTYCESYHYQERVNRAMVPGVAALARHGQPDLMADPRMQAYFRRQITALTPRDPRNGVRNVAPIGDAVWHCHKPSLFAAGCAIARHNPALGQELVWAWNEQGRPTEDIVYANMNYYAWILGDPAVPARAPDLGGEVFSGAAVVFRSRFNSPAETYLHLRAADFALPHFEQDQLCFHWDSKASPLCIDWGGYFNEDIRSSYMHNEADWDGTDYMGEVVDAQFLPRADYAHVRSKGSNRCVRRLLFVRGDAATDIEYLLVRDSLAQAGRWNLWTLAKRVEFSLGEQPARAASSTAPDLLQAVETARDKTPAADLAAIAKEAKDSRELLLKKPKRTLAENLALLQEPLLPRPREWLPAFAVPLRGTRVKYTGAYGVDLAVQWLTPVDRVEMGAHQWGITHRPDPRLGQRGLHQKLLRLHRNGPGEFLVALHSHLAGREPEARFESWGEGGVKVTREDGARQYAWISAPAWPARGDVSPTIPFRAENADAQCAALVVVCPGDVARELTMIRGKRLRFGDVAIQGSDIGSVGLRVEERGLKLHCTGPSQELAVRFPRAKKAALSIDGKPQTVDAKGGQWVFPVPSGSHHVTITSLP